MPVIDHSVRRAVRGIAITVILALGTTGLGVSTAPATGAAETRAAMHSSTYEEKVQKGINRVRAEHGLRPLRFHECTDGTAERWARRLARSGRLYHQDPRGILRTCGARYAGETLGMGAFSPAGLVRAWMDSPAHRPILLSRSARLIGVGTSLSGGQWVTAANFTKL
jgi:uncharacterized protein YkwD